MISTDNEYFMPYPIIGMSPGNSYFKDEEVAYLLEETVKRFGRTAILVADIPAIATYMAYGYPESRARNKAVPKGNNLKNRSRRIAEELGIKDKVRIIDWKSEVENDPTYRRCYMEIHSLYDSNLTFAKEVERTTLSVLENNHREILNLDAATKMAAHYLLSELAFLEFAPSFLRAEQVVYVYHRNWPVYERYVSGVFDDRPKGHLEFLLLENPKETYRQRTGEAQMERIQKEKVLRCSFAHYPPGFIEDPETGALSGIFHDLITAFAEEYGWCIEWSEETGYGVIGDGLQEGRFDIFVAPTWPIPERIRDLALSQSVYESEVSLWVRESDKEIAIEEDTKKNSFFRVAVRDGDISESIANADFPKWRKVRVPQLTDTEEMLRFVADSDADAAFVEAFIADGFNEKNGTRLVNVSKEPVRVFGNCFVLSKQNVSLKMFLDAFIEKKVADGTVRRLLLQYAPRYKEQGILV